MAQNTKGAHSILSLPWFYDLWNILLGGTAVLAAFTDRYLKVKPGDAVLDIGCGTGTVLAVLPEGVEYTGFDPSGDYVAAARARFGAQGSFFQASVAQPPDLERGCVPIAVEIRF